LDERARQAAMEGWELTLHMPARSMELMKKQIHLCVALMFSGAIGLFIVGCAAAPKNDNSIGALKDGAFSGSGCQKTLV